MREKSARYKRQGCLCGILDPTRTSSQHYSMPSLATFALALGLCYFCLHSCSIQSHNDAQIWIKVLAALPRASKAGWHGIALSLVPDVALVAIEVLLGLLIISDVPKLIIAMVKPAFLTSVGPHR